MTNASDPSSAKSRLEGSRSQLLCAMGFEEGPSHAGRSLEPVRSTLQAAGTFSVIEDKISHSAVGRWWHRNALRSYLQIANPLLVGYARRHPGKLIAYGAGTGALLWIVKPWRLLSATTIATLLLSNTDVAALIAGAVKQAHKMRG